MNMAEDFAEDFEVCTGCGLEAFICVVGNGDPKDAYNGPYALCEGAYGEWQEIGDEVVLIHD